MARRKEGGRGERGHHLNYKSKYPSEYVTLLEKTTVITLNNIMRILLCLQVADYYNLIQCESGIPT